MRIRSAALATATIMLASGAFAHVIDKDEFKDLYKLRADVGKQVAKYTFCLVKAATSCEKKGLNSGVECTIATGAVSFEAMPGKVTEKFQAAIAKCDAKQNLSKKGSDYVGIGCPGDCNTGAAGLQQCASMAAFETNVETPGGLTSAKVQLGVLASVIDAQCGVDTGEANTHEDRIACVTDSAKALTKYSQGLFKCQGKCELDLKGTKGGGGLTNGEECKSGAAGADDAFEACDNAALAKVVAGISPSNVAVTLPLVRTAVNDASEGLYNRFDPTGTPETNPCGTCGNNAREGSEECDGTSDAACPGSCAAACTCP